MNIKSVLPFFCALLLAIDAAASTMISSDIDTDTHWRIEDSPFIVDTGLNVARQTTLTIDAGVVVMFNSGRSLTLDAPYKTPGETGYEQGGVMICNGTSVDPVVFTSHLDSEYGGSGGAQPGDWTYIQIQESGNTLEHCRIKYGGSSSSYGSVRIYECSPTIQNNTIEYSENDGIVAYRMTGGSISGNMICDCGTGAGDHGISLDESSPSITGNTIQNSFDTGIFLDTQSLPIITGNTITGSGRYPIHFRDSPIVSVTGNSLEGNGFEAFGFDGLIQTNTTLIDIQGLGWPYVFESTLTIDDGVTVTVPQGTILKGDGAGIVVDGLLDTQGTAVDRVVFTSYQDDTYGGDSNGDGDSTTPASGDWNGIELRAGANVFEHCIVRYAGDGSNAAIEAYRCSPTIRNNIIEYCEDDGIRADEMATDEITGNTIKYCGSSSSDAGINLIASSPLVSGNSITFCDSDGIYTIDGDPEVVNNIVTDNSYEGIAIEDNSPSFPAIRGNTVTRNGLYPLAFDGSVIPSISGNVLTGNGENAFRFDGDLYNSTTLINIQGLGWSYVVDESSLEIENGAILTVPAGTVILGKSGRGILAYGIINVQGSSANKVIFTSYKDEDYGGLGGEASGDWNGIELRAGANVFEHCIVRYAGDGSNAAIEAYRCSPTIRNNIIEYCEDDGIRADEMATGEITGNIIQHCGSSSSDSGIHLLDSSPLISDNSVTFFNGDGIYTIGGDPAIINNTIMDNTGVGLVIEDNTPAFPAVTGNMITRNASYPFKFISAYIPVISDNNFFANTISAFGFSGTIPADTILGSIQSRKYPYVFEDTITVPQGITLSITRGSVLKGNKADIIVKGIIDIDSAPDNPVVFTSYRDDEHGGDSNGDGDSTVPDGNDWGCLRIENSGNIIRDCLFRYGGEEPEGTIYVLNCAPEILDNIIEYGWDFGIRAKGMNGGHISGNTIRHCGDARADYGIYVEDSSVPVYGNHVSDIYDVGIYIENSSSLVSHNVAAGSPVGIVVAGTSSGCIIQNNDISGNDEGLLNEMSSGILDARSNWWGSVTGPSGYGDGVGDSVGFNVDYAGYLSGPINRYYSGNASIVGHVYHDTNSNGQYDSGEGIEGARVRVTSQLMNNTTTGSDGAFELVDIPGDAGYVLIAEAFGFENDEAEGVWVNALNTTPVDIALRPLLDIADLSVEVIRPNPNDYDHDGFEDPITLMKGGTAYRYYRVINSLGQGVPECQYTIERSDGVVITNGVTLNYQGLPGVMQIGIPESTLGVYGPSGAVSCVVTHLNGVELPSYKKMPFLVQVRPREYETEWKTHLSGSVSGSVVGKLKVEAASDYIIKLEESDGSSGIPDALTFERGAEVGGGVGAEAPFGVKAGAEVGPVTVDAGWGASAEAIIGAQFSDEHRTLYESSDLDEAIAKGYLLAYPSLSTVGGSGLMPFLVALENMVVLPPYKTAGSAGIYFKGAGKAWAGVMGDISGNCKVGLGGNFGVETRADAIARQRTQENDTSFELGFKGSLGGDFIVGGRVGGGDEPMLVAGLSHSGKLIDGSFSSEVIFDDSTGLIKYGKITTYFDIGVLPFDTIVKRTWTFTGTHSDLEKLFVDCPIFAASLAGRGMIVGSGIVFESGTILTEFQILADEVADSRGRLSVSIEDHLIQLNEHVAPKFGVSGSIFGAGGSVSVGAEFSDSKSMVSQKSVLLGNREYALASYEDDSYTPRPSVTIVDIYEDTWADIGWDGLLNYASNVVQAGAQTVVDISTSVGQGVVTLADGSIAVGTEVFNNAWAGFWSALAPPQTMGASTYGTMGLMETKADDDGGTNNWRFGIGGFYDLQPAGTVLSSPGSLVISYAGSEVEGIPEDTLAMYLWNTNSLRWDYQGGTVDLAGNSVSNQITVLGLYTLAPRMPYDFAELTPVPSAIPNDGASTVVFTSGVMSNDDNTVISDGQLFSVSASGGTITTPDADGTVTGLQVMATSGQISFTVQSSLAATSITVNASSVIGEAFADGQVAFVNAGAPTAPQNVAAEVDGTAIRVSWQAITNSDVVGYTVLYDDDNGEEPLEGKAGVIGDDSPVDVGNVSAYRLYGLENNATYYVRVKATDAFGMESPLSSVASVLNTCPPDSDADGLPDSWESQFSSPTIASVVGVSVAHFDSLQDNDFDGMNNISEYIAGTDPTDSSSLFGVADATVVQGPKGVAVEWDGVNGRTYQVYVTTDLVGSWTAYGGPLTGSNGTMRVTVPITNAVPQFIKLNVQKD
jgi:parallel beta-helix repeat protein